MTRSLWIAVAVAMLSPGPAAAMTEPPETVRVGSLPALTSLGLFIAHEKGYFAAEGLDARILLIGPEELLARLERGELDVAGVGLNAGFYAAVRRGLDVRLVADKGHTPRERSFRSVVVSRKLHSGPLGSTALRGRRFAVPVKGYESEIVLERFLARYGLRLADVALSVVPYGRMNAALADGSLFGAVLIEPFLSEALRRKSVAEVVDSAELYPLQQGAVLAYSGRFARLRTGVGVRFMAAYLKGVRDLAAWSLEGADRRELFAIVKKYKIASDFAVFETMRLPAVRPDGRMNKRSAESDLRWHQARGSVGEGISFSDLVDDGFREKVKKAGR